MNTIQMKAHINKTAERLRGIAEPFIICYHDSHDLLAYTIFRNPSNKQYTINDANFELFVDEDIPKAQATAIHAKILKELEKDAQ